MAVYVNQTYAFILKTKSMLGCLLYFLLMFCEPTVRLFVPCSSAVTPSAWGSQLMLVYEFHVVLKEIKQKYKNVINKGFCFETGNNYFCAMLRNLKFIALKGNGLNLGPRKNSANLIWICWVKACAWSNFMFERCSFNSYSCQSIPCLHPIR